MINLDEIKDSEYINEEGKYKLTIKEVDFSTTDNGNDCHTFKCENEDGLKISVSFYFTEKALWRYRKFLEALGHPGKGNIDEQSTSKSAVGKSFLAEVKRKKPRLNIVTNEMEESKYFEVVSFEKC